MEQPLRILILEDMEEDAGLVEHLLKKANISFVSKRVDERLEFIQAVEEFAPNIILSDHSLPQFNSTEALKICKEKELDIPFILVTGTVSEEFAVESLKQGADDYILKSNLTRLPTAIKNSLKQKEIQHNRRIAEKALLEQNEELTKINQELDRFVYSASHDLRAPLKSVLGLVKLSQEDYDNKRYDQFPDYLQMMEKSVIKLDSTIKDIINYSRNARTEVIKEKVNLHELITCVLEDMKYLQDPKNIEKKVVIDEKYPLYSDTSRLNVVLNNLISNSIKYSNSNVESVVNIHAIVHEDKAVIEIQDNGIGIEETYLDKIFNMFYRATSKSEGSGLGLYIVKETLEKMNGSIHVSSVINEGTKFIIEIPNYINGR